MEKTLTFASSLVNLHIVLLHPQNPNNITYTNTMGKEHILHIPNETEDSHYQPLKLDLCLCTICLMCCFWLVIKRKGGEGKRDKGIKTGKEKQ